MSANTVRHDYKITKDDRERLHGHRSLLLWFTGLSGSGKSTLANLVEVELNKRSISTFSLDGDNIRQGINKDLSFAPEDRTENIRRIGEIAKLFVDSSVIALSSFISPYRADRDQVRALHVESGMMFIEVFVDCALEEAEKRDPKGLYKKARAGEIKNFTGIDDPYEAPESPEIHLHTDQMSLEAEVELLIDYLEQRGVLTA
jgi:adenylylsulfate kinase